MTTRSPRLLYFVSLFPCWSETFIVREIKTLLAAGAEVQIISLKPPYEKLVQPDAQRLLPRARHPLPPAAALLARARAAMAHPRTLASVVSQVSARLRQSPRELAKSLEAIARAVEHLDWIREFDPDVIHAHWATYPSTAAWALAKLLNKPFGFTCHAHDIFVNNQLLKEKIETARLGVTISKYNVNWLAEHVTPLARERLHVVHCGVDLSTLPFKANGRQEGLIVSVGRLDTIKGFDVLIDAIAIVAKEHQRVRCRIVGSGPLEADLRARIAKLGLENVVQLCGALPEGEVRAELYAASVFVMPSVVTSTGDRDGIPVSLMEAMAAGTPAVSTRVSGIPELIEDEHEGLLCRERDAAGLARAMARLLTDPVLGSRLATNARKKVEQHFDASREAQKLLGLFRTVQLESPGQA